MSSIIKTLLSIQKKGLEYQSPTFSEKNKNSSEKKKYSRPSTDPTANKPGSKVGGDRQSSMKRKFQILGSMVGGLIATNQGSLGMYKNASTVGFVAESTARRLMLSGQNFREIEANIASFGQELGIPEEILKKFSIRLKDLIDAFRTISGPQAGQNVGARIGGQIADELHLT